MIPIKATDWAGSDGNWSAFKVEVGTPSQGFLVLPSTANGETWIPVPEACSTYGPGCAKSRGVLSTRGASSEGFRTNESTSWDQIGIYELGFENALFGDLDTGLYGQETIRLGPTEGIENQTVAGIATANFWLGSLGLGIERPQFDGVEIPTILSSLKKSNATASEAYGYSAGAAHRGQAGGLVLGGYDPDAIDTEKSLVLPLQPDEARSLTASLRSIVVTSSLQGTVAMPILSGGLNVSIDSTVSDLWLPPTVCDEFAESLGLTFDESTELYLVNSTIRDRFLTNAPELTFTMSNGGSSNHTVNIVLPYAAFDLQVQFPYFNDSTSYFPIRRAANETQYVLGRTFLQEAYLVVDWERRNFTIGQSLHIDGLSDNVVGILPPTSGDSEPRAGLSTAEVAGTAVAGALALGLAVLLFGLLWRRRRSARGYQNRREQYASEKQTMDGISGPPTPFVDNVVELMSEEQHEAPGQGLPHQLMSNEVFELRGQTLGCELSAEKKGPIGHNET